MLRIHKMIHSQLYFKRPRLFHEPLLVYGDRLRLQWSISPIRLWQPCTNINIGVETRLRLGRPGSWNLRGDNFLSYTQLSFVVDLILVLHKPFVFNFLGWRQIVAEVLFLPFEFLLQLFANLLQPSTGLLLKLHLRNRRQKRTLRFRQLQACLVDLRDDSRRDLRPLALHLVLQILYNSV